MGSKRFDTLIDCMRHGAGLTAACRCGNRARLSPGDLVDLLGPGASPDAVAKRLRCTRCGAKGRDVRLLLDLDGGPERARAGRPQAGATTD
jgi:hypothetical protein